MKHLFLIIVVFGVTLIKAQVMWQVKSESSQKWYLQDADEFSDPSKTYQFWKNGYPWGPFLMNLDLIYKEENALNVDGKLVLITKKETTIARVNDWDVDKNYLKKYNKTMGENNSYTFDYSGGALSSFKKFKYGYFEMRFKANKENGMWPAFWLFGGEPNEEIDFYEGKGDKNNYIHVDVHCPKGCDDYKGGFLNLQKNWGAWIKLNQGLDEGWNIISGEWQANYVKFFLNGQPIGYFEGEFKTAQNLIINSAVAKNNQAFNPGPDKTTTWPNEFYIDYVRIWNKEDTNYSYQNNYKIFENTAQTIENSNLYTTSPKGKVNFVYKKKELNAEQGTITLLPVFYNKYSLSIAGKKLNYVIVEVFDRDNKKMAGYKLNNVEYYILDLSALDTGPYDIRVTVMGQTLVHNVPVINPAHNGEQKR